MKQKLNLFLSATILFQLLTFNLMAQPGCGTVLNEEQINYFTETQDLRQNTNVSLFSNDDEFVTFQLVAHIARDANGNGGLSSEDLEQAVKDVNTAYEPVQFNFEICNINYIDNQAYFERIDYPGSDEGDMAFANLIPNKINIFFVPNIYFVGDDWESRMCGWAYYPSHSRDWIMMSNDCSLNGNTLAHELGHYFNLNHTFETRNGVELVNDTNCAVTGDGICDTPADPTGLCIDANEPCLTDSPKYQISNCTDYNTCTFSTTNIEKGCNLKDENGDTYKPDPSNVMSYNYQRCATKFSPQQITRMQQTSEFDRDYLLHDCEISCDNILAVYNWLNNEIDCTIGVSPTVSVYKYNTVYNFLDIQNGNERHLYLSDGDLYCSGSSVEDCITDLGLTEILATCSLPCPNANIEGCTELSACNYDATATIDDGSCEYGCSCNSAIETYPWLSEFLPTNTCVEIVDYFDGIYLHFIYVKSEGKGTIYLNYDGKGINYGSDNGDRSIANMRGLEIISAEWSCNCGTILGCTNAAACNFNPQANVGDGSCEYDCDSCNSATDAYPWLSEFIPENTCTEIVDYCNDNYWHYIYVKSGDKGLMYLNNNGEIIFYGTDSGDRSLPNRYGFNVIAEEWSCGCNNYNGKSQANNIKLKTDNNNEQFNIYPNPSPGKIFIELNSNNKHVNMLTVFDLNGKALQKERLEGKQTMIDLSELAKGVYMIEVQDTQNSRNTRNTQSTYESTQKSIRKLLIE